MSSKTPLQDKIRARLEEALDAVLTNGKPDHVSRLRAAELLLRPNVSERAEAVPESATIVVTADYFEAAKRREAAQAAAAPTPRRPGRKPA